MVTQDGETGKELERRDLVKGFEFKKNTYLILTDDDFDSVKVESSSMMTVEKFVEAGSIDPMYYDASYFMAPDGKAGEDVYAVLREAITKTGMVALSRFVISQRERTIALRPMDNGSMAHTLYEERYLNSHKELFEEAAHLKPDPEMVTLATQLIKRQVDRYDPSDLEDRYKIRLRAMIDAKLKGEGVDLAEVDAPEKSNVIDLMAALTNSLGQEPSGARTQAAAPKRKAKSVEGARVQPGLKLPIRGGKVAATKSAGNEGVEQQVKGTQKAARKRV